MRTTALIRATGLTAVLGSLAVAAPAQAVTTIGSDLSATPSAGLTLCPVDTGCTLAPNAQTERAAAGGPTSPIAGVVVRWRVKSGAAAQTSISLRVVRGNTAVSTSAPAALTSTSVQTFTFPTRLAVRAGDRLGLDLIVRGPADPAIATPAPLVASFHRWEPRLADGAGRPPDDVLHYELLLNADIEADADADGFGDETQDGCVGQAGTEGGCPPPPPPPPADPVTPPSAGTGTGTPITPPPSTGQTPSTQDPSSEPSPSLNPAPRITSLLFNATRVSFRISEPARVSLLVQRLMPGKRVGARCLKPTSRNRRARNCSRLVRAVTGRTDVEAGLNRARLRRLPPGRYRVRLHAIDPGGRISTHIRYFRIKR